MEEEKIVEAQVEEVKEQPVPEQPQEIKPEELAPEKIKQIQDELNAILEKNGVTIEVVPTYNLIIKQRK